jgi:diaminohydroxyphosphoribosylaminopyrimidine deaminase/5-amino-6-(5-phosphoribosylamino)uracil reductase
MARALHLAALGRGRTAPNPMVGAVVVRAGAVVGEGYHARAGEDHAEVVALRQAGPAAQGADLYVTLEPCSHFGRTPPCVDAIVRAGVGRVFAATQDPNPRVNGQGIARLREAGIPVSVGLLAAEAHLLNEVYCKHITTGVPHVTLKAGMSLDGKIATRTGESRWITGEGARLKVHELRNAVDAILVGIGTILADDPELTTRIPGADCRNPDRIVIDSLLRIPLKSRVLARRSPSRTILVANPHAPEERVRLLRDMGAEVIIVGFVPGGDRRIDLQVLMRQLGGMGITSVLVEGGSEIAASSLEAGIVDKVVFFIAPSVIGGRDATPVIGGRGVASLGEARRLRDVRYTPVGDNLMVEGYLGGRPCSPA